MFAVVAESRAGDSVWPFKTSLFQSHDDIHWGVQKRPDVGDAVSVSDAMLGRAAIPDVGAQA